MGNIFSHPLSTLLQAANRLKQFILTRTIKIWPQYSTSPLIIFKHSIALLFLTPKFLNSELLLKFNFSGVLSRVMSQCWRAAITPGTAI